MRDGVGGGPVQDGVDGDLVDAGGARKPPRGVSMLVTVSRAELSCVGSCQMRRDFSQELRPG